MPLDITTANLQIMQLSRQSAAAAHAAGKLEAYRNSLGNSWSGKEAVEYERIIDSLIGECRRISADTEALGRDMARAVQEILEEEAAGLPE